MTGQILCLMHDSELSSSRETSVLYAINIVAATVTALMNLKHLDLIAAQEIALNAV